MIFHLAGQDFEQRLLPVWVLCAISRLLILQVDDLGHSAREVHQSVRQVAAVQDLVRAVKSREEEKNI